MKPLPGTELGVCRGGIFEASGTSSIAGGWDGADEKQIFVGGTQIVEKVRESVLRREMSFAGSSVNFLSSSI